MTGKPKNSDPYGSINRRLDMLIAILLAQSGLTRKEVAKIFRVSEDTLERLLPINWKRIQGSHHE